MNGTSWAAFGAIATSLSVLIYAALLWFAASQVREAARLRRAQMRPFVVVDIPLDWVLKVTVENIGATVARDVTFEFPVKLESSVPRPWEVEESPLLRDGVAMLPPRKKYSFFFDSTNSRFANETDLPMSYEVIVRYSDDEGARYEDHYTLDIGSFLHANYPEKGLPQLVKEVADLRKEIHKWTDGSRGLRVRAQERSTGRTEPKPPGRQSAEGEGPEG